MPNINTEIIYQSQGFTAHIWLSIDYYYFIFIFCARAPSRQEKMIQSSVSNEKIIVCTVKEEKKAG